MKIVIFSDSHLTDKFDNELFNYISKIIEDVDQVIINGDFWDAYLTTFDKFVKSEWKKLFPLLKQKNTIYIFGNHDKKEFMDKRFNLFSIKQVRELKFKLGKRKFCIAHGHLIAPTYDSIFLFKNPNIIRFIYPIIKRINIFKHRKNIQKFNTISKFILKHKSDGVTYIFGHSHISIFQVFSNFVSLGCMQKKQKNYCLIDGGKIYLY